MSFRFLRGDIRFVICFVILTHDQPFFHFLETSMNLLLKFESLPNLNHFEVMNVPIVQNWLAYDNPILDE